MSKGLREAYLIPKGVFNITVEDIFLLSSSLPQNRALATSEGSSTGAGFLHSRMSGSLSADLMFVPLPTPKDRSRGKLNGFFSSPFSLHSLYRYRSSMKVRFNSTTHIHNLFKEYLDCAAKQPGPPGAVEAERIRIASHVYRQT